MKLNPISFEAAVNLHAAFWENNMNLVEKNFELDPWRFVVLDVAYEYGLEIDTAKSVVSTLYIKSVEDLNSRFLCHVSKYSMLGGKEFLENDLYNAYGYVVPYDIVHGLVVSRKPLEQL